RQNETYTRVDRHGADPPSHRALSGQALAALATMCVGLSSLTPTAAQTVNQVSQPQPPKFQSSVEVMPVDVTVVDDHGKPVRDLTPADFNVRVDGTPRRVVSAEWLSLVTEPKAKAAAALPEGYTSNENATGGRLIVLA